MAATRPATRFACRAAAVLVALTAASAALPSAQSPDRATVAAIREEGLRRSQVIDLVGWLSDVYGPRVTGTPAIEAAREWAADRLRAWGVENVREERFAFGRGWSLVRFHAHMVEPQVMPIIGYPRSWSPSTSGTVEAEVVRVDIRGPDDLERYRGTLAGKIVLPQPVRAVPLLEGQVVLRLDEELLAAAGRSSPAPRPARARRRPAAPSLRELTEAFYREEGVVAVLDRGIDRVVVPGAPSGSDLEWPTQRTDGGTVFVGQGGSRDAGAGRVVPSATIAVEHYNRMARVLERGLPVRVELNIATRFHEEEQPNGFNLLGEIPGTDRADEVVLLGAHFDSTPAATGATDNAAGVAAMMEALRILQAVGAAPRRTIRIALWGGEEQGLLGSRAYVRAHYADRDTMRRLPAHEELSAYYNLDNGAGRIRGIWLQGNDAGAPIFESWMADLADLGVTTIGRRSTRGTDHVAFDEVGLPGFQFLQDRLEYNARTHHSNMDFYDRVPAGDVMQMAVVAAVFAYNTAMLDERLPRKTSP